jgi:hypothetical protein
VEKVQIIVNNPNISKLHSERNQQQQNAVGECLLPFGPESSAVQFATQNVTIKIHRTLTIHVVLNGCETWSLTRREEHRLRVFEIGVLRMISGLKRER